MCVADVPNRRSELILDTWTLGVTVLLPQFEGDGNLIPTLATEPTGPARWMILDPPATLGRTC